MKTAKRILSELIKQAESADRKTTAQAGKKIASILQQLDLQPEDLQADRREVEFYYRTSRDKKLLLHVAAKVLGADNLEYNADPAKNHLYFEVDPLEEADIDRMFAAYKKALEEDIEQLEEEFYERNSLIELEERMDYDDIVQSVQMLDGIDKQLEATYDS